MTAESPLAVPVGYWCANVAYPENTSGGGVWWLGWEWFDTPAQALGWLREAACLMAEQLDPAAGHLVRVWADGDGFTRAQARLDDQEGCAFEVCDDGVRYELSVQRIDFPPLVGLDCFTPETAAAAH